MGKASMTLLSGVRSFQNRSNSSCDFFIKASPSRFLRYIAISQTLQEFSIFEMLSPLLYLVVKVLKVERWKGQMDRLTEGLYKIRFLQKPGSERDMCEEEGLRCHSHLSREVPQVGDLLSQQGRRVPESNSRMGSGWWKERRAERCLVRREGRRGVSRDGYRMVRSLETIHHHQYLHQFSQTLTIGSTGLGGEFGFLEKSYKSQTGRERAFSEHWFGDVAEGSHQQECSPSPQPHKMLSTHTAQPVPVQSSLLPQSWVPLCNQAWAGLSLWLLWGHCFPQAGPAGTSSRGRVTCLTLSMAGLTSSHKRQGCPALSHIKFSPAFSLPNLIVRNKNSIWAIKRQHLLNVCRLPEIEPGSPLLLRLT